MLYRLYKHLPIFFIVFFAFSCSNEEITSPDPGPRVTNNDWLIPPEQVLDGGTGRDGIPSIDDPQFDLVEDVNRAFDDELVIGLIHDGEIKGYPVPIMDWHEIVNDEIGNLRLAITYCPLTGTAIGWQRQFENSITTFGVSGLLFNNNLMPYDRNTNSLWSQQSLTCVNGPRIGTVPKLYPLIETSLATWRASFPGSKIMNANTGFDRQYSFYPYGNYRTNQAQLFFPISRVDTRLPQKERVLGIIVNEKVKTYPFPSDTSSTRIIKDTFEGLNLMVIQSTTDNFNTAFVKPDNVSFSALTDAFPAVFEDDRGNQYDLSGRVISGVDMGMHLEKPPSMIGYWFSWSAFYEEVEIYN